MRVLLAWEVGRNFGHVTKLVEVARPLAKRKAELFFALQNPAAIRPFSEGLKYQLLQAPYYPVRPGGASKPHDGHPTNLIYPDDLRPCGYDSPKDLAGLIQAWRGLYEIVKPDVLLVQAAPTALLAARGLKFKKVTFGGGYDVPPRSTPMPLLPYWEDIGEDVRMRREEHVLGNINIALTDLGLPQLKKFSDLLETDAEFLDTFEELDHYPGRRELTKTEPNYCGPFFSIDSGESLSWNKNASARIFGYIRPDSSSFGACMEALARLPDDHDIIVAAPGIPIKVKAQMEKPSFRIVDGPVRLDKIIKKCDLGISHGSPGVVSAFVLNGVPQLLLPNHIEQLMCSRAVGRMKSGRGLMGEFGPIQVASLIERLLNESEFKEAANNLAQKYKGFDPSKLAGYIADEITKLVEGKQK